MAGYGVQHPEPYRIEPKLYYKRNIERSHYYEHCGVVQEDTQNYERDLHHQQDLPRAEAQVVHEQTFQSPDGAEPVKYRGECESCHHNLHEHRAVAYNFANLFDKANVGINHPKKDAPGTTFGFAPVNRVESIQSSKSSNLVLLIYIWSFPLLLRICGRTPAPAYPSIISY